MLIKKIETAIRPLHLNYNCFVQGVPFQYPLFFIIKPSSGIEYNCADYEHKHNNGLLLSLMRHDTN